MESYKDGVMTVKKKNKTTVDFCVESIGDNSYKDIVTLRFSIMTKRIQDQEFIEAKGHTLSLKLKTRLCSLVFSSEDVVCIGDKEYSIVYTDDDKLKKETYFYLETAGIGSD